MGEALQRLSQLVHQLNGHLTTLQKYAADYPDKPKSLFQKLVEESRLLEGQKGLVAVGSGLSGYLVAGARLKDAASLHASLLQTFSSFMASGPAIPRSCKEALSDARSDLGCWKLEADAEQQAKVASSLDALYLDAVRNPNNVEQVEVAVDAIMSSLLIQLFGQERLETQELEQELSTLESGVHRSSQQDSHSCSTRILSLALNSLQRLHAAQLHVDAEDDQHMEDQEQEVDDEDEDDDDMFFMPVPSAALKIADEKKFASLAQPITSFKPARESVNGAKPMLEMEEDSASSTGSQVDEQLRQSLPGTQPPALTPEDFEPVAEARPSATQLPAATANGSDRAATGHASTATQPAPLPIPAYMDPAADGANLPAVAAPGAAASPAKDSSSPRISTPGAKDASLLSQEGVDGPGGKQPGSAANTPIKLAVPEGAVKAPDTPPVANGAPATQASPGQLANAGDDKHSQFVSFLQGQNPNACMFHAQMRLSLEGCRKLANFLAGSNRVRALSLSHNFMGDDGMEIICEGLRANKSVTSIDLPDNSISDEGVIMLAESVKHNTSLTQMQLASNNISDAGAIALAGLIRTNQNLKKLGLAHNKIGKAGCQALTAAISGNKSLQQLQLLPGNPVEEKDAKALAKAMQSTKKFSIRSLLGM